MLFSHLLMSFGNEIETDSAPKFCMHSFHILTTCPPHCRCLHFTSLTKRLTRPPAYIAKFFIALCAKFPGNLNVLGSKYVPTNALYFALSVAQSLWRRTTGWKTGVNFSAGARDLSLLNSVQTDYGTNPGSCLMGIVCCFPWGIQAGAWSSLLTSTWCRGEQWRSYTCIFPQVFFAWCLFN
jgi:hypothetical protein